MHIEQDIIFFDLETTGLELANDRIIQISAIKLDKDMQEIGKPVKRLVNPQGRPIHPDAYAKHGISAEELAGEKTFDQIAEKLYGFFEGCALAGYNILNFDIAILTEEFKRCGMDFKKVTDNAKIVDVYKIMNKKESRTLEWAHNFYLGSPIEDAHDATQDNLATIGIFKAQADKYGFKDYLNEADDLTRRDDDGNEIIDFAGMFLKTPNNEFIFGKGKHKGKKVNDGIDTLNYMKWIRDRSDFGNNTKHVATKLYEWADKNLPEYSAG